MEVQKEVPTPNPSEDGKPLLSKEQTSPKLKFIIFYNVITAALAVAAVWLFVMGGFVNTGYLWIFVFLTGIFLLPGKTAMYFALLIIASLFITVVLQNLGLVRLPYQYETLVNFFIGLLIFICLMSYIFYKKEKREKLLKSRVEYLKNERLVEGFLQVRALELERTKIAMTKMTKDVLEERDRLEKEKAKATAILQSIGEGLFATGLDGNLILINSIAEELLGLKKEAIMGKLVNKVLVLNDEEGNVVSDENSPICLTLKTGGEVNNAYIFVRKDGKKIALNITTTPIKQREKVIGAIGVVRDVTKEKEVDRMKTEFISLASHQLRTPLSAIKWFIEMLLAGDAGKLNPEQNDFAKNISDSTERMIDLVNSLLNISRIESGRIIVSPEPTDLKKLVEGIATELASKLNQKRQVFILSAHDSLPKINIDPRLIAQVYLNLLTNAIKYSPIGAEITVFISRKNEEIISQVSDNGCGIPRDQQRKVFKKFFRAENVVKMETDGTGLGLYLIKAIVESSKGKIWFESEEGKGTTFWFSLPLAGVEPKKGEVTLDSSV